MSDLFWLTDEQMASFPVSSRSRTANRRVDERRALSGIIFINRNGLRWRDAPEAYGPHKKLYSRWKRWSAKGIFAQMMVGMAAEHIEEKTVMNEALSAIGPRTMSNATYLKAHRTANTRVAKFGG